jgi:glycine hydroxymethyltransferase
LGQAAAERAPQLAQGGPAAVPASGERWPGAEDGELEAALGQAEARRLRALSLLPSEPDPAPDVLRTQRAWAAVAPWAEGPAGARQGPGGAAADAVEELARRRLCALFGGQHAGVQPHSLTAARLAAVAALAAPGQTVLAPDPEQGAPQAYGGPLSSAAALYRFVHYAGDREGGACDPEAVEALARECRPSLLVAGGRAGPWRTDFAAWARLAEAVGARLLADVGPFAGLVAAGLLPNPVPFSDAVVLGTAETLRGPRGGAVICRGEHARALERAVWPALQDAADPAAMAAMACCFAAAAGPAFAAGQRRIRENARALAAALQAAGLHLVGGGTETHLVLLDLRGLGLSGRAAERACERIGLLVQRAALPSDPLPPPRCSGLRAGTAALSNRGMGPVEMRQIAEILAEVLRGLRPGAPEEADPPPALAARLARLAERFPPED